MQRLTSRNQDNSISVDRVSGQDLLHHLAMCEDKLECIEDALEYLSRLREAAFYKSKRPYYSGKYAAYHKSIETIKLVTERKKYGR